MQLSIYNLIAAICVFVILELPPALHSSGEVFFRLLQSLGAQSLKFDCTCSEHSSGQQHPVNTSLEGKYIHLLSTLSYILQKQHGENSRCPRWRPIGPHARRSRQPPERPGQLFGRRWFFSQANHKPRRPCRRLLQGLGGNSKTGIQV